MSETQAGHQTFGFIELQRIVDFWILRAHLPTTHYNSVQGAEAPRPHTKSLVCSSNKIEYTSIKFNVYPPNHRFAESLGDIGSLKDCPLQELNLSGGGYIMEFTGEYG